MKQVGSAASIACRTAFQNESISIAACRCNNGFSKVGSTIDRRFIGALGRCFIRRLDSEAVIA
jgi:hypothetical protein